MSNGDANEYVLGHSAGELKRLRSHAQLLNPITRRYLMEAGIAPGMRVLDVGSGVGDVAFLAAELVGPSGHVVGVDRSRDALALARSRANEQSLANVTFVESELMAIAFDQHFDAAIGRYVLCFQLIRPRCSGRSHAWCAPVESSYSMSQTGSKCVHIRRPRPTTRCLNGSMKPLGGLAWT